MKWQLLFSVKMRNIFSFSSDESAQRVVNVFLLFFFLFFVFVFVFFFFFLLLLFFSIVRTVLQSVIFHMGLAKLKGVFHYA